MPFGTAEQGFGALLGGILQGLEQGKQRQQDLEHRKDLLKLEQDKIKLLEKEQELKAAGQKPSLKDLFMSTPGGLFGPIKGGLGIVPGTQPPTEPESLSSQYLETPWGVFRPTTEGGLAPVPGVQPPAGFVKPSPRPDLQENMEYLIQKKIAKTPQEAFELLRSGPEDFLVKVYAGLLSNPMVERVEIPAILKDVQKWYEDLRRGPTPEYYFDEKSGRILRHGAK